MNKETINSDLDDLLKAIIKSGEQTFRYKSLGLSFDIVEKWALDNDCVYDPYTRAIICRNSNNKKKTYNMKGITNKLTACNALEASTL